MVVSEKCHAISAINCLATHGSISFKFVGAACRINMSLLAHKEQTVRAQACDFLLNQILSDQVCCFVLVADDEVIDSHHVVSSQ